MCNNCTINGEFMTLPFERTNAVVYTKEFLQDLLDPKKTPRVPKKIRRRAHSLLKHYPGKFDLSQLVEDNEKVFGKSNSLDLD